MDIYNLKVRLSTLLYISLYCYVSLWTNDFLIVKKTGDSISQHLLEELMTHGAHNRAEFKQLVFTKDTGNVSDT